MHHQAGGSPDFNPLRREGGDRETSAELAKYQQISIHSAARAETGEHSRFSRPDGDFNPLRREGGDGEAGRQRV